MLTGILEPTHLVIILIVALLFLGPKRLPDAGRALGQGLSEFKRSLSGEHQDDPGHRTPCRPRRGRPRLRRYGGLTQSTGEVSRRGDRVRQSEQSPERVDAAKELELSPHDHREIRRRLEVHVLLTGRSGPPVGSEGEITARLGTVRADRNAGTSAAREAGNRAGLRLGVSERDWWKVSIARPARRF